MIYYPYGSQEKTCVYPQIYQRAQDVYARYSNPQ